MISLIVLLLFPYAIKYKHGPEYANRKWLAVIVAVLDVIANYTELALLTWDFPKWGSSEVTFSMRMPRLLKGNGWVSRACYKLALHLNKHDPGHINLEGVPKPKE